MEVGNHDFCAARLSKRPEEIVREPLEMGDGEYGVSMGIGTERRSQIVQAYLKVLENIKGPIATEDQLPFPKEQIGRAILSELEEGPECILRRRLEIAYVLLESFIPSDDYRVIENFKNAGLRAQLHTDMTDPTSIMKSAQLMKKANGDNAVRLQERIYEKMRERQKQIDR